VFGGLSNRFDNFHCGFSDAFAGFCLYFRDPAVNLAPKCGERKSTEILVEFQCSLNNPRRLRDGDIIEKKGRSALSCTGCTWTKSENGLVIVPYILSPKYTSPQVSLFMNAMQEMESVTCVRFVRRTNEDDYLNIVETGGCASFIGKIGGAQDVYLNSDTCMTRGTIQHEIQHSLGFVHEHSRSDRDNYVNIMFQYISPESVSNFEKEDTNNLNKRYDYFSVMHYPVYAFSNTSGKNTIVPKPDPSIPIGQRNGLSILDVAKINALYQCGEYSSCFYIIQLIVDSG
uniref:Metalloendopeptidase n=1 Tax=Leptobrachium leishanense TaxID=445787 RepID=A0A8C5WHB5_9ANUR